MPTAQYTSVYLCSFTSAIVLIPFRRHVGLDTFRFRPCVVRLKYDSGSLTTRVAVNHTQRLAVAMISTAAPLSATARLNIECDLTYRCSPTAFGVRSTKVQPNMTLLYIERLKVLQTNIFVL